MSLRYKILVGLVVLLIIIFLITAVWCIVLFSIQVDHYGLKSIIERLWLGRR